MLFKTFENVDIFKRAVFPFDWVLVRRCWRVFRVSLIKTECPSPWDSCNTTEKMENLKIKRQDGPSPEWEGGFLTALCVKRVFSKCPSEYSGSSHAISVKICYFQGDICRWLGESPFDVNWGISCSLLCDPAWHQGRWLYHFVLRYSLAIYQSVKDDTQWLPAEWLTWYRLNTPQFHWVVHWILKPCFDLCCPGVLLHVFQNKSMYDFFGDIKWYWPCVLKMCSKTPDQKHNLHLLQ